MMLRHAATRLIVPGQQTLLVAAPKAMARHFSSNAEKSPGVFGRMQNAFTERQERNQQQQFAEQLEKMASSSTWTIKDFAADINKTVGSWRTKIPGMANLDQVKKAKQINDIAQAIVQEVGADATSDTLVDMTRTDKLKVSINSGASIEEINAMMQQVQAVGMMHQVVRQRKLEGKAIPTDEASMRSMMQVAGLKSMSKSQRKAMQASRTKQGMRGIGKSKQ